jgi:hypothetical protein
MIAKMNCLLYPARYGRYALKSSFNYVAFFIYYILSTLPNIKIAFAEKEANSSI